MRRFVYSRLGLAVPVVIAPAGVVSDDVMAMIRELAMDKFRIETRQHSALVAMCQEKRLPLPGEIWAQFIPCRSLEEFVGVCDRLESDEGMFYLQCVAKIIIIDYKTNNNIQVAREQCESVLGANELRGFVYYRAGEELTGLFNSTTCISFDSYSPTNVVNHVRQFVSEFVIQAFLGNRKLHSIERFDTKRHIVMQMGLQLVSVDPRESLTALRSGMVRAEDHDRVEAQAALFETAAVFVHTNNLGERVFEKRSNGLFGVLAIDAEELKEEFEYLSTAMSLYSRLKNVEKMVDCCLKLICFGDIRQLEFAKSMIQENVSKRTMKLRALELIYLCWEFDLYRKSSLYAFVFSKCFTGFDRIDFQLLTLNILRYQNAGLKYMLELAAPLVETVVRRDIGPRKLCSLVSDIVSAVGYHLGMEQQAVLLGRMANLCLWGNEMETKLHLPIKSAMIAATPFQIRRTENSVKERKIFLYDCLGDEAEEEKEFFHPLSEPIHVVLEVSNAYAIPLPITVIGRGTDNCHFQETTALADCFSKHNIGMVAVPVKTGKVVFEAVQLAFYGMYEIVKLPKPLAITVVELPAVFFTRTDLPLNRPMSLFIGERVCFHVWVANNGRDPITAVRLNTSSKFALKIETDKELPLKPLSEIEFTCSFIVESNAKTLDFDIVCSSGNQDLESIVSYSQPLNIVPGIVTKAIFAVRKPPAIENLDLATSILIGIEIENQADDAFSYVASFKHSALEKCPGAGILTSDAITGVIAKRQTMLHIIAIDRQEVLQENSTTLDGKRTVHATKAFETKVKRKVTADERLQLVKLLNVVAVIERNLEFEWRSRNDQHGILPLYRTLPNSNILKELETHHPKLSHCFKLNDTQVTDIPRNTIVDLCVDFGTSQMKKCKLNLGENIDPSLGILWDGGLSRTSTTGETAFVFRLCFTKPGVRELTVAFENMQSVRGSDTITTTVK